MTIFVDMDEVLADTFEKHLQLYNQEFGEQLTKNDCLSGKFWDHIPEEKKERIKAHIKQPGFFRDLNPMPNSQDTQRIV